MSLWFKHDAHFHEHPKVVRLRRLAGSRADSAEVGWWRIVAAAKRYGEWTFEDEDHLKEVAGRYAGFIPLYRECGFLDELTIHNADDYQASRDPRARTRMGVYRAKKAGASAIEAVEYDEVFRRSNGVCGICGQAVRQSDGTVDHVVPLSKGGDHTYANVVLAHTLCNTQKAAQHPYAVTPPVTGAVTPPVTPREEQSREERAEQTTREGDLVDDYYRMTARFPNDTIKQWLERLSNEFGHDAASRKLGAEYLADTNLRTLLGRVENALKSDAHITSKKAAAAEKARLEEWNASRQVTPEQAEANRLRIAELQRDWFGKKEDAA